jgi:hypothetical protein
MNNTLKMSQNINNNINNNNNNNNTNNKMKSSLSPSVPKWLSHVKFEHLLAGVCGGVASTLVLHPLDLLKVRLAGIQPFIQ